MYVLFVGCRGANVGVDTPVYFQHFYTFGQWGCSFVEIGFDWINRFCYHNGWNQSSFFCISAAMTVFPVAWSIGKYASRDLYSMFMLLFCTTTFISMCNGMRQNIACGILFSLILFVHFNKKSFKINALIYICGILFASLFHASVLLVAPVIFFKYLRLSQKWYVLLYLLSFVFILINVSQFFPDIIIGKRDYGMYLNGVFVNNQASYLGFTIITFRNVLVLLLLFRIKAFDKSLLLANLTFVMLLLTNLGFNIPLIGRINMYFVFFFIYYVATIFVEFRKHKLKNSRILVSCMAIIYFILFFYSMVSPANKILPHTFYWENSKYEQYVPN